jgi:hypothetical protein
MDRGDVAEVTWRRTAFETRKIWALMRSMGQTLDAKTRITVRNLRMREDTANYLINLDPESAYYDPKTRSI